MRRRSFLALDVLASLALLIALATVFTIAVIQLVEARQDSDARRLLRLAAEAEFDQLRAGLKQPEGETWTNTYEDGGGRTTTETSLHLAAGEWSDFTRVQIVARRQVHEARWIRVELSTYIPTAELRQ